MIIQMGRQLKDLLNEYQTIERPVSDYIIYKYPKKVTNHTTRTKLATLMYDNNDKKWKLFTGDKEFGQYIDESSLDIEVILTI